MRINDISRQTIHRGDYQAFGSVVVGCAYRRDAMSSRAALVSGIDASDSNPIGGLGKGPVDPRTDDTPGQSCPGVKQRKLSLGPQKGPAGGFCGPRIARRAKPPGGCLKVTYAQTTTTTNLGRSEASILEKIESENLSN
jgi:hypothetical protein